MKIVFDKLKDGRTYPVDHKDFKRLFRIVPESWIRGIKLVHFLGQEPHASRFNRPVRKEGSSHKLNLSIVGLTKENVILETLTELIQSSGDEPNLRSKSYRELEKDQIRRIKEVMKPYLEEFNNQKNVTIT